MPVREKSIYDYFMILYRRRFFLIAFTGIVTCGAIIVSLLLPKWYVAEAVVMPPKEEFSIFPSSSLSRLSISSLGIGQGTEMTDRYLAILNSRSIFDRVVEKFDMVNLYEAANREEARKILQNNVNFEVDAEGTVRVGAWDKSAERASEIANYFVALLDDINKMLSTQEARFKRLTIQKRYDMNVADLARAEEEFKAFQEKNGVIALPEQTEVTIQATAELLGQLSLLELELGVKEKSLGGDHPEIRKMKSRIEEQKKQINTLMYSKNAFLDGDGKNNDKVFIPFNQFPDLSIQYIRLKRNLETQQTIFAMLTEQLELALLMETKETPSLQVLDEAIPPFKRAWPRRSVIVILTAMSSFLVSSLYMILKNYVQEVGEHMRRMAADQ